MKRIHKSKRLNRNNNSFNHLNRNASHLNAVSPELLVGQIWLQDEPPSMEITELNSSNEFKPSPDDTKENIDNVDHAWSYASKLQEIEDNYKINKKARERRRMNLENRLFTTNTSTNTNNDLINKFYPDIAGNHIENNRLNHQVNCFTIINKHFINSDTSSEGEFADVEIIASNEVIMEPNNWDSRNNSYEEEIITYDPESSNEARTIWIYSFKNKHLLTENDYELSNIVATGTSSCSTSCSFESDEERTKDKSTNVRKGSPIPASYIPKFNLSLAPTLSTVTEVSEPTKQPSSNGSHKSFKNMFQKPNSWFSNNQDKLESERSGCKTEKTSNIVNWMSLSPREKRLKSKEQFYNWDRNLLEPLPSEDDLENIEHQRNVPEQDKPLRVQVDVDVHVSVNEKYPERRSLGTPISADVNVLSRKYDVQKSPMKSIKHADTQYIECTQDRGDHDVKFETTQQVLCQNKNIKCDVSINNKNENSVNEVNSGVWDRETNEEKETASYNYVPDNLEYETSSDHLWMKNNMPFLKPSHWNEYLPIAESPLTLHLSLGSIIEERQSWFHRFIKYINCCK